MSSSPAFPPESTQSSPSVSVTAPNLTMPPENDFTPPPSPPAPPPEITVVDNSSPPVASPESSPLPLPLSPPPTALPLPLPPTLSPPVNIPQIPPVAAVTPPALPEDPSPLPPLVSPPAPPAETDVPSLPPPTNTRSSRRSHPKESATPPVVQNPTPRPRPRINPTLPPTSPVTNISPPRHHHQQHRNTSSPTSPSTDPATTPPSPSSRSSHSSTPTRNPDTSLPQEPAARAHDHPPFPPVQASAPDASSPPPGTVPDSEMPLFPHSSAPESGQPLLPGGGGGGVIGSQPASSVLPIGVDMGGARSSSSSTARVPVGVVVGLGIGGVVLVLLLVFGIMAVLFTKKRRGGSNNGGGGGGGLGICKRKGDGITQGKSLSLPRYSKQTLENQPIWGYTSSSSSSSITTTHNIPPPIQPPPALRNSSNPAMTMAMSFSAGTFTYEELSAATGGFSESNVLGQGGFGYVFKGVLPNGKEVAVKQLKLGGEQGEREFQAEVETISQVHHKHLVSLVGYCIAGDERLLVYEFVPNNTLDFHLHGKDQAVMPWSRRLKIAIGSGKGLAYLHEDCNPRIIHRDIKASNILLDLNCEAKVSDFGLAKMFSNTNGVPVTHITTRVMGTFGYLAPEYASSGSLTEKSDVYSYGVMLLELITGRPPINHTAASDSGSEEINGSLVNWARPLLAQAIEEGDFQTLVDPRLQTNYNRTEMASMVACAAACIRLSAWRRPRMCQVVRALEGDLSPSDLDDGVRPGQSSSTKMHYFPYETTTSSSSSSSSIDVKRKYIVEEMKRFKMAALANMNDTSSSTEYGVNPSSISTGSCSDTKNSRMDIAR